MSNRIASRGGVSNHIVAGQSNAPRSTTSDICTPTVEIFVPGPQGPPGPPGAGLFTLDQSGAVGNGVADDQPVIQAWLNNLSSVFGAAEVLMPPGKWYYIHAAPLYVPPHIVIRGTYNCRDNQTAGGQLFGAGGFFIDPALPAGIVMSGASMLRQLKVYRAGMTANASTAVASADYATWTAEGVYKQVTGSVAVGATTIPLTDTNGINIGMLVTGPGGFSPTATPTGGAWTLATVTAVNPGVSVTVSSGPNVTVANRSFLRFGASIGVIIPRNAGGILIDEVQVLGFRTGIQVYPGQYSITRGFGDCITNLELTGGGDVGVIRDCEYLPLYGMPVSTNFCRAGDAIFVHDCANGAGFYNCFSIGWMVGWHFESSGCICVNCGNETVTNAGPGTENWVLRGGSQMGLISCHAQAGGIGFHLDGTNRFLLLGCDSSGSQIVTTNNTAHFLIENVLALGGMYGAITSPSTLGGYPSKASIKYGAGTINGLTISDVNIGDLAGSPTVPFIQGTLPNSLSPKFSQGIAYQGNRTTGGTTVVVWYWNGIVFDAAATLATHTIQLPPYPADGQNVDIYYNVGVTALTYATTDGSLIGNYDNPMAGERVRLAYSAAQNKWFVGGAGLHFTGGTVPNATTFSATGTALTVTNGATVGSLNCATTVLQGTGSGPGTFHDIVSASGNGRFIQWFSNGTGGANLRWRIGATSGAESGGNAGTDFTLGCFDDNGVAIGTPLIIARSSMLTTLAGQVILRALQLSPSYANDAAAFTGGVALGQLYRNGSVVQIRVT